MTTQAVRDFRAVEQEQTAFDAQLPEMLRDHAGEFVLFKDGQPVEFFSTYDEAYRGGLARFGVDATFLVSEVKRRTPQSTSLAWEAGVMFSVR
jgi:hypothetical protein